MPSDKAKAVMIVEYVLDYVERVGRFEGRGKDRELVMPSLIVLKNGHTESHTVRLVDGVQRIMTGRAVYSAQANGIAD